jgi:hypothetical protein
MTLETETICLRDTVVVEEEILRWGTADRIGFSPVVTCMLLMAVGAESLRIIGKTRSRAFDTIGGIAVGRIEIESADCHIREESPGNEKTKEKQNNSPVAEGFPAHDIPRNGVAFIFFFTVLMSAIERYRVEIYSNTGSPFSMMKRQCFGHNRFIHDLIL